MRNIIAGFFLLCIGAKIGFGSEMPDHNQLEIQKESASLVVLPVIWNTVKNAYYFASGDVGFFVDDVIYTDLNLNRLFHLGERNLRGARFFMPGNDIGIRGVYFGY